MILGKIKPGFKMQTTWGSVIEPKRYRLIIDEGEKYLAISFKMRGGWFVWR